jgi:hypothetical protein
VLFLPVPLPLLVLFLPVPLPLLVLFLPICPLTLEADTWVHLRCTPLLARPPQKKNSTFRSIRHEKSANFFPVLPVFNSHFSHFYLRFFHFFQFDTPAEFAVLTDKAFAFF